MSVIPISADSTPSPPSEREPIDLRSYWRIILRRRWLILPFFAAVVLVTALVSLRQSKIYDATCTIIIDLTAPRVLDSQQMQDVVESGTGGYWYSKEYYETQYKVILSRAVAQRVVDKLLLTQNLRFLGLDRISDPAALQRVREQTDAVTILQKNLKLEPVKDSRVVRLRYEDRDPELAAVIANTVAEMYIEENLAVRTSTTRNASDWLEKQLGDLEVKLEKSGKELFEFKKQNDIVSTTWEDRQNMVSQRLTAINEALTHARVHKAQMEAKNEQIRSLAASIEHGDDSEAESLQSIAENPTIQQLKLRYLEAMAECSDMKLRYLEHHPKSEACEGKVGMARTSLRNEIKTVLGAAQKEYEETLSTERKLLTLYNDTKTDAFSFNQHERAYTELKRAYDNNQRLYDMVLKRLKDTGVSGMLQVSNVRILDRARANDIPVRPKVRQNIILAIILGLMAGIALALAVEFLDTTIISQEQIEEKLGLVFLGIIPRIERSKDGTSQDLIVHAQPKSAVAECMRSLRTNLLFMSPEKPLRTILVTSSGPQEGKTTTAAALAETMAESGNRVLLVDADMRRPRIHRIFGQANSSGLSSLILGEEKFERAVKATLVPNLFILPCGPVPPNPAELLHTSAFSGILELMTKSFDRVIIDSPPIGVVADAMVLATRVDGTLMVFKAGRTSRDVARQAVKQLRELKARIFGAVLNDLDLENQKYGQHYYYYKYGYYYGDKEKKEEAKSAAS